MRHIFEEYGRVIIAVLISACLIGIIFSGIKIIEVLGNEADIDAEISHSQGENALKEVSDRAKPNIHVADPADLKIPRNKAFQPLALVSCEDSDGESITPVVIDILYIDGEGNRTELYKHYNSDDDILIVNKDHYIVGLHNKCSVSEFADDQLIIPNTEDYNKPGTVVVTYTASDLYNVYATKKISFVIDNK